jgi:adenylate cyclase
MRLPVAHAVGAVLAAASGTLTNDNLRGEPGFGRADAIAFVAYLAATGVAGTWWGSRTLTHASTWLLDGREPARDEQRRVLGVPAALAIQGMLGWLGAATLWSILTADTTHNAGYTLRIALSILLGGLATSGLAYLITEWAVRPIVTRALAVHVPERAIGPGVRMKLLLSWMLGADVFLLMIGLTFVDRPATEPPPASAIWFIIGAGLVAGTLVVYVATRSLAIPLRELRRSVAAVQRGQLDLGVQVDDGGELGLLQAGFNSMVGGLRERRTLEDLFGRHVGEDVARRALQGGVVLGGERREVGVVFVDLIGSTRLAQSGSPESVVALLNDFFGTVVRVVAEEGGWVNKFEGDGALCVFGAPMPLDDCALRALRAARTLRRELLALAAAAPELDAGIGVSAGTVVAGNVGAENRYEYTVIGSPVNEAARLTDEAKHRLGRVLAGEDAVARAQGEATHWAVAAELTLRGYDEPTLAYEPSGGLTRVPPHEATAH